MGTICSIYLISEKEFDKVPRTFEAIEKFLEKNSPLIEEKENFYFKNRQDTDTAWNPTFELLNKIFTSNKDLFIHADNKINNLNFYYQNSKNVSFIADQLSKIDENTIFEWLKNKEIKNQIKFSEGYKMEGIDFPDLIAQHFEIIKSAYLDASSNGRGIILSFG